MGWLGRFKKFFGEVVTLSSKYRVYVFILVLFILAILPMSIIEETPKVSICSRMFGDYCYSVGITRGVASLLRGNFKVALDYNFLAIPTLLIIVMIIIIDFKRKLKK